ncbi:MAG TPA: glycosyltransferase family 4 protein [Steroidobacteraceae bacterium]|nr:glycosyltransferase family 4 protein [Steroidobacteraceae bacterium]
MVRQTGARPIRVLYLDHTAQLSGGELALARLLGALDRTRVEPIVVLAEDGPLYARLTTQHSIDTHILPLSEKVRHVRRGTLGIAGLIGQVRSLFALWGYARRISRFARRCRPDLIYTNSLKSDFYGALAAQLSGVPVIWHIRDRIEDGYLPRPAVWLVRTLARHLPICVVANSASTLATLRLGGGRRTAVIASGLTREHIERCHGPRPVNTVPQIGMIGRLASWKGQDVFLRAAALLLQAGVAARFRIVGSAMFGEEACEQQLRQLAATLGIEEHVEFLGFSDVPTILLSLDVLVHASTMPEPFGQVIIEGLAAGLPVIASDGGGAREIIEHGKTGLLVRMGDPAALAATLAGLLADPEQARRLGVAGRRHALENFTVEQSARRSETLYEELLQPSTERHTAVT